MRLFFSLAFASKILILWLLMCTCLRVLFNKNQLSFHWLTENVCAVENENETFMTSLRSYMRWVFLNILLLWHARQTSPSTSFRAGSLKKSGACSRPRIHVWWLSSTKSSSHLAHRKCVRCGEWKWNVHDIASLVFEMCVLEHRAVVARSSYIHKHRHPSGISRFWDPFPYSHEKPKASHDSLHSC